MWHSLIHVLRSTSTFVSISAFSDEYNEASSERRLIHGHTDLDGRART